MTASTGRPYVLISSDAHAGADLLGYRTYLPSSMHDEFDQWAAAFRDPWSDYDQRMGDVAEGDDANLYAGVASFMSPYNWESDLRIEHMNQDGIAAEVVFPNTVPPFYPSGVITAGAPSSTEEYRLRFAGVQAHNRWVVDFCAQAPVRRAGLAQVFLHDVDDAVAEVRWAKEAGLAGVLIPGDHGRQLVDLYPRALDPFWATCSELGMPVHRHSQLVSSPVTPEDGPAASAVGAHECFLLFKRGLSHLIYGGVFERHPDLRVVFTETGFDWLPPELAMLDMEYHAGAIKGSLPYPLFHRAIEGLSMSPTEYFRRNCFIGASAMLHADVERRHELGVDRIMWGADYPHHEGTFPHTSLTLRLNFWDVPEDEVRAMTSLNAAELYGFDLDRLQLVADRIGPTVEEVARPATREEIPSHSGCVAIAFAQDPSGKFFG